MFRGFMTDGQIREIRRLYATKRYTQDMLAAQYEVSRPTIRRIVLHDTYKHVDMKTPAGEQSRSGRFSETFKSRAA